MTQSIENTAKSCDHALVAETSVRGAEKARILEALAEKARSLEAPAAKQAPPTPGAPHPPKSPSPAIAAGIAALEGPGEFQPSGAVGASGPGVESDMRGSGPGGTMGAGIGGGIDGLIGARQRTHGDFERVARIAQAIKRALADGPAWATMTPAQRESLESKATKLARIVCGDPDFEDHWLDDIGYSRLVLERLPRR